MFPVFESVYGDTFVWFQFGFGKIQFKSLMRQFSHSKILLNNDNSEPEMVASFLGLLDVIYYKF